MTDNKDALRQRLEELVAKEQKEFLDYPKAEVFESAVLEAL